MTKRDMFLKIDTVREGPINGESLDEGHKDEINVLNWSWGLTGHLYNYTANSKPTSREIRIVKAVDGASSALMSAVKNNAEIKKAVLTVRKAVGGNPIEFLKITLEKGSFVSVDISTDGCDEHVTETVVLVSPKVTFEYVPQDARGQAKASKTVTLSFGTV